MLKLEWKTFPSITQVNKQLEEHYKETGLSAKTIRTIMAWLQKQSWFDSNRREFELKQPQMKDIRKLLCLIAEEKYALTPNADTIEDELIVIELLIWYNSLERQWLECSPVSFRNFYEDVYLGDE